MADTRLFTKTCSVDFTTVSSQEYTTLLDDSYAMCTGLAVVNTSTTGADRFRIALLDDTRTYIDPVTSDLLEVDASTNPTDRFIPIQIRIRGQQVKVQIIPLTGGTSAAGEVDVIFRLEKK